MDLSLPDQLAQLDAARQIVLQDAALYPQIVTGILPIVGVTAPLELRKWGAEFLAETFASPAFIATTKEHSAVGVLGTLKDLLEKPGEDAGVIRNVIQTAASIYGLVFKYIIENPHDVPVWNQVASIKSNILKRWDTAPAGIRICCMKFVQNVIQIQTPGPVADPRRPDKNETSISLVPRDHPLIPPSSLEPEASGLLDRLLSIFSEDTSDAVLVTAALNCLGPLLRTRQSIVNKILSVVLSFNPLKQANSPMSAKAKVQIKSMERTTKALLMHVYRRNETSPTAGRIKVYIDRLTQSRMEVFDEGASRKRGLPSEPTDGLDGAKRRRLGAQLSDKPDIPPLPPGPTSWKELFTLTTDPGLVNFDVTNLPLDLMMKITLPVLQRVDQQALNQALDHVRTRWQSFAKPNPNVPQVGALGDDEEDYEPDFQPSEDREQILNKADILPPQDSPNEVALGPFELPQPPPLTTEETEQVGKGTISRVFSMMSVLGEPPSFKRQKPGLSRLAGSNYDKEAWVTVITRLATRSSAGLNDDDEEENSKSMIKQGVSTNLHDGIRETLAKFIREDFRSRIPIAIAWLNEEWFDDQIQRQAREQESPKGDRSNHVGNYEKWMLKVLDGIIPYLDAKDKILVRFLGEVPEVSEKALERVKGLAKDPERVQLAVTTLLYIIMFKVPARAIAIDALEDLWRHYDDAKAPAAKYLAKWRPHILKVESKPAVTPTPNGVEKSEEKKNVTLSPLPPGINPENEQVQPTQGALPVAAAG